MSIGSRTDKKQGFQDKVDAVNAILDGIPRDNFAQDEDDNIGDDTEGPSMHDNDQSMADPGDPNIQPGLDQHRIMPQMHTSMQASMGNMGSMHQQMMHGQHDLSQQLQHHMHTPQHISHSPHPLSHSMNMQ